MKYSKSDSFLFKPDKDNLTCKEYMKHINELKKVDPDQVTECLLHGMTDDEKSLFRNGVEFMRKRISIELFNAELSNE